MKSGGRPDAVPQVMDFDQAKVVLSWPDRTTYYKTITPEGYVKGPKPKIYDGTSRGLCPAARDILLERFPEFAGQNTKYLKDKATAESVTEVAENYVSDTPSTMKNTSPQQIPGLVERLLEEKDKRIELLENQLKLAESREGDLAGQLQSLREKYDQVLKNFAEQKHTTGEKTIVAPIQKRDILPGNKGKSTPPPV